MARRRAVDAAEFASELPYPVALRLNLTFEDLWSIDESVHQIITDLLTKFSQKLMSDREMLVRGEAHSQSELRIILEERVRPRGALTF